MEIKPLKVGFSNGLIKAKTNFYREPRIVREMQLIFEKDHYNVSGNLAIVGKLKGKEEVFFGKTKPDIMLE